jgi:hypothetical protein
MSPGDNAAVTPDILADLRHDIDYRVGCDRVRSGGQCSPDDDSIHDRVGCLCTGRFDTCDLRLNLDREGRVGANANVRRDSETCVDRLLPIVLGRASIAGACHEVGACREASARERPRRNSRQKQSQDRRSRIV